MSETLWTVLMNVVAVPLGVLDYLIGAVAELLHAIANIVHLTRRRWIVRVRLWSGRTWDGKTSAMLAEEEERRDRLVAELRALMPPERASALAVDRSWSTPTETTHD